MLNDSLARQTLQQIRERRGLSRAVAARQLGCSPMTLMNWETGTTCPVAPFRVVIQLWSDGAIPMESWPLTKDEESVAKAVANYATRAALRSATEGTAPCSL